MAKIRRESLFLIAIVGLLLSMAAVMVQYSYGCYTKIPSNGPRLLRAKALFGAVMRICHKEVLSVARNADPKKFKDYLRSMCATAETCMMTLPENTTLAVVDCLERAFSNKACFRANFGNQSLQTTTDSRAFAIKAIKEFGWM